MNDPQYIIVCDGPNGEPVYWINPGFTTVDQASAARFTMQPVAALIAIQARERDGHNWQAVAEDQQRYSRVPLIIAALFVVAFWAVVVVAIIK